MLEGGKPQLLFYAKTSLSKNAIEHVFNEKNDKIRKMHDSSVRSRNEKQMETDGNVLYWIPTGELKDWDVYADGMRMNRNGKDVFLKMVPSAAACVIMFKRYLEDKSKQFEYENKNCKYGYPVLNGCGINEEMIVEHPIPEGESVIICSDGYILMCVIV